jgi:predicted transposase YbfD/YdcC
VDDAIITADAISCQRKIAAQIIDRNPDYILAVNENRPGLPEEIEDLFKYLSSEQTFTQIQEEHGRKKPAISIIINKLEELHKKEDLKNMKTIIKIDVTRVIKEKKTHHTRYYLSGCKQTPETFNTDNKTHRSIENSCHLVLDALFNEDKSRKRKDEADENIAVIRKIALNLLKNKPYKRFGV